MKDAKSAINNAFRGVKTKKRILITGTPIQNNLMEFYQLIDIARPKFFGSQQKFEESFARPIR